MQKTLQDLHISHERNKSENIPILVEERWGAFQGIPKLRRLSLLEYLHGVPWASPSLRSSLSSFSSYPDLLDLRTLHPHKTLQKLCEIHQYNKANHYLQVLLQTHSNFILALYLLYSYFTMVHTPDTTHGFIKISKQHTKNRICQKQNSLQ